MYNFPENIICCENKFHECEDCIVRQGLITLMNKKYDYIYNSTFYKNPYFTHNEMDRGVTKIFNERLNKYEKMSRGQKLTFLEEQSVLKVLYEHYADKENSKIYWHNLLNNIPKGCIVIQIDHMSTVKLGANVKSKSNNERRNDNRSKVIPIGVVFCYKCPETKSTQRLHRIIVPDTLSLTSFQVITSMSKIIKE